jgi:hypothetical protein
MKTKRTNNLFFILDNITNGKINLLEDGMEEFLYSAFMINKCLSYYSDTVMHANEMNTRYMTPKRYQYEYLHRSIRKRKRFSKMHKKLDNNNIKIIMEFYDISAPKAQEYLKILSTSQLKEMASKLNKGGLD